MKSKTNKQILLSTIFVSILLFIDQFTKQLAEAFLKGNEPIPIINDVFELKYLENASAAFGLDPISILHNIFHFKVFIDDPELYLNFRMVFFYILTFFVIVVLILVYLRIPNEKRFKFLDYILLFIIAGAIGNLIDRITHKYVIDFLYFKLIDFPIFNVADIYVTCSAFLLLALGLFYYKDEDYNRIFPSKKG